MNKQISLKHNVIANYVGQAYKALIGIIMMPIYLSYLGSEAFGLIGFYVMLQSWMQLLDLGMKPTLARESSKYRAGSIGIIELRTVLRTLEVIFVSTGILVAVGIILSSNYIAISWLNVINLDLSSVSLAIVVMAIIVAARWVSSLYTGVLAGLERQVWINSFEIVFNTLRFVFVLIPFEVYGARIEVFFIYQMIISICELITISIFTYSNFDNLKEKISYSFEVLKKIYKFSFAIAFGSIIWVVVTQIDKLVLSKYISLEEYGYFSLAIVISNGVFVLGNAIGSAIMPRMTIYSEQKKYKELENLYFLAIEIVLLIVVPISALLVFYGEEILYLWTKDLVAAKNASEIMKWYVLGNAMVSMGAFAYYLQYAKGDLKLHLRGNIIYAIILIPLQIYMASNFGPIFTGILWFIVNLFVVLFWIGFIHKRFLVGKHLLWLWRNLKMFFAGYIVIYGMSFIMNINIEYSLIELFKFIFLGIISLIFTFIFSTNLKRKLIKRFKNA